MATVEITRRVDTTEDGSFRLRIWVSKTSHNIPSELFVFQKVPKVPFSNIPEDWFVHIPTYSDVITLPVGAPEKEPFFRKNGVDVTFQSRAILEEKWIRMKRHIQILIEDIVRLNKLPPIEVTIVDLGA
jgi:hypothetical protein